MADDWLEALEKSNVQKIKPVALPDVDEKAEDAPKIAPVTAPTREKKTPSPRTKRTSRSTMALLTTTGVLVVIGIGSLAALSYFTGQPVASNNAHNEVAETSLAQTSEMPGTSPLKTSDPASVGNACDSSTPTVAEEKTIRGAITEFETAYFARDSERLDSSTTQASPLRKQNWDTVLAEAAPDGTTWCAELGAVDDKTTTVDVDLTMTVPGKPPTTYQQRATGENTTDGWKLVALEARQG